VGHSVHPQAQQVLDGKAASGVPPLWELTPSEGRAVVEANGVIIGAGPDVASVRDITIPSQAGGMPARVYSPTASGSASGSGSASAPGVVVYYHGGGWVVGSVNSWDACCRLLAVSSGCDVVSVDYRLAAGRPIVVAGDSAGGNLALVTALRARDAGGPALAMQLLVYPVADSDLDRKSYHEYDGDEFIVNRGDMVWFWNHYAPDPAVRLNPYASPLRAGDLTELPPAYVITAEHDPLRDEGFECAERLRAARVPVEHRHFGSQIHGFFTFVNLLDDADRAVADAGEAIRAAVLAAADASGVSGAVSAAPAGADE